MAADRSIMPRLLTEKQAKAYLGGCNPGNVVAPLRIGRNVRWDISALEMALDRLSGIPTQATTLLTPEQQADREIEAWRVEQEAERRQEEQACRAAFRSAGKTAKPEDIDAVLVGRRSLSLVEAAGAIGVAVQHFDTAMRIRLLARAYQGGAARFTKPDLLKALGHRL